MPGGHSAGLRPAPAGDRASARGSVQRRHPPLRRPPGAEGDGHRALCAAGGPHAPVGASDAHLRHPRARRPGGPGQGAADPAGAADPHGPPAVPERVLAVLGGPGHRLCRQPGDDVPAAAHGGSAAPVGDLGRTRGLRRGHDPHRGHRGLHRGPLGRAALAAPGHDRGAGLRRRHQSHRTGRHRGADPVPGGELLAGPGSRRGTGRHAGVVRR